MFKLAITVCFENHFGLIHAIFLSLGLTKSVHILFWDTRSSWENEIPNHTSGKMFDPSKGNHVLKRAESHRCEVNTSGILACNFSIFFKVSQGSSF